MHPDGEPAGLRVQRRRAGARSGRSGRRLDPRRHRARTRRERAYLLVTLQSDDGAAGGSMRRRWRGDAGGAGPLRRPVDRLHPRATPIPGNSVIDAAIRAFVIALRTEPRRSTSLGARGYWRRSASRAAAVDGNSSSGIRLRRRTGRRRSISASGRTGGLRAASRHRLPGEAEAIYGPCAASSTARSRPDITAEPPYGRGRLGAHRPAAARGRHRPVEPLPKHFHDPPHERRSRR